MPRGFPISWSSESSVLSDPTRKLMLEDFCDLFEASLTEFDEECQAFIDKADFSYTPLTPGERDQTILEVMKRIDHGNLTQAGREGRDRWEQGWSENLENFIRNAYDPQHLVPRYYHPNRPIRLRREYYKSTNQFFELDYYTVLKLWLYKNWLKDIESVYEFGCGPGYNLHLLASIFPDKQLFGLDWSANAVELVNLIGQKCGMPIKGQVFDMFDPPLGFEFESNAAVMTLGGLEQLGGDSHKFIDFLVQQKPRLILHIEPLFELYDKNNLLDYLALRFHQKRNYLVDFLPYLKGLEEQGRITIHKINRSYFGSLFHDGWSMIFYSPQ